MDKTQPHPADAFIFRSAPASMAAKTDGAARKFTGTPYSGNVLAHPYWDAVIFDLSSTSAPNPTPILIGHDRNQRAGFATLDIQPGEIKIGDGTLLDNEHGRTVAAESDQGFPWQMSVHIEPASIEHLKAGTTVGVNGQQVSGPCVIFRNNTIREVSFTPTGVDPNTDAHAMSMGASRPQPTEDQTAMDLKELQARVDELEKGLKASQDETTAANARATAAETALADMRKQTRMSQVKGLFSAIGREYSDEAAAPYLGMDETTFAAVAADLGKAKPAAPAGDAPAHLFSAHATNGTAQGSQDGADAEKFELSPIAIYAQRKETK